jgi:hypothetical protein
MNDVRASKSLLVAPANDDAEPLILHTPLPGAGGLARVATLYATHNVRPKLEFDRCCHLK